MIRREETFDRICAERRWTPEDLAAQAPEALARLIAKRVGAGAIDVKRLGGWAKEYAKRKAGRHAREIPLAQTTAGGAPARAGTTGGKHSGGRPGGRTGD
jgi:hypothetical protein